MVRCSASPVPDAPHESAADAICNVEARIAAEGWKIAKRNCELKPDGLVFWTAFSRRIGLGHVILDVVSSRFALLSRSTEPKCVVCRLPWLCHSSPVKQKHDYQLRRFPTRSLDKQDRYMPSSSRRLRRGQRLLLHGISELTARCCQSRAGQIDFRLSFIKAAMARPSD